MRCAPRRLAGPRRRDERGAVTAELAVALIAIAAVLASLLWLAALVRVQITAQDAAAAGARLAARGETTGRVVEVVHRLAGPRARAQVSSEGGLVVVTVVVPAPAAVPGAPAVAGRAVSAVPAEVHLGGGP